MILIGRSGGTIDVPTPTAAQVRATYLVTLTGTDGTVWDLNSGPVQLMAGVRLFDVPPVTQWLSRSPGLAGARRTGVQVEEQTLQMPVRIKGDDWRSYRDLEAQFFGGLDPDLPVTIAVTSPDAVTKTITGWFTGPGDLTDTDDPLQMKRRSYQLGFVAPDAYWQGPPLTRSVSFEAPIPFLNPPGPPIYLNPPSNSQNATIDNPGDVSGWTRVTLHGPATGFTISIGDSLYVSTATMATTAQLIFDGWTRSILNASGTRRFDQMDQVVFKPLAPGVDIPIGIDVTGYDPARTRLDVELAPLYRRPL